MKLPLPDASVRSFRDNGGRRSGDHDTATRRNGFILVAVLVLILLISMIAVSLMFHLKAEDTATHAGAGSEQAWSAAMSGVQEAIRLVTKIKPGSTDWEDNPGAMKDRLVFDDFSERWYFTVYSAASGDDVLHELRYGLTAEAGKLNINAAHSTNLLDLPRMTPSLVAALRDFIDPDDMLRPDGAEQSHYDALPRPYAVRNGPLETLDELLLVRGFTPSLLYGEDANMNWRLDLNENDGDERPPSDNNDGKLDRGLSPFLTVSSYDPNEDNEGVPRTDFNLPNDPLPNVEFPAALTNFISALRTNNLHLPHAAELLEGKIKIKDDKGKEIEIASGVGKAELPQVLDLFCAGQESRFDGLVDINTASIAVLKTIPGIDTPLAESILSARRSISPERRGTIAWLFQEDVVDAAQFKQLAPFLTARSFQYSFHVVGYGVPSGRYRVLDVIIDLAGDEPRIIYLRDLTKLGMPFPITGPETETAGPRVKAQAESARPRAQKGGVGWRLGIPRDPAVSSVSAAEDGRTPQEVHRG